MLNAIKPVELSTKFKNLYQGKVVNGSFRDTSLPQIPINTPLAECQRDLYENNIKEYIKISGGLDWKLFGYVTAVRYPAGKYDVDLEIINGQHRMSLAKTIDPSITEVPAHIIDCDTKEEAYRYFGLLNGGASRSVSAEERFWSMVLAQDPTAKMHESYLIRAGLSCGKVNKSPTNSNPSVKYPNFKKAVDMGIDEMLLSSSILIKGYFKKKGNWSEILFTGLTRAISFYPDLKDINSPAYTYLRQWLENDMPTAMPNLKKLQYKKYQNTSDWSWGVARGLIDDFVDAYPASKIDKKLIVTEYEKRLQQEENKKED